MKKIFTLLVSFMLMTVVFAQPINDDCAGAIDLGNVPVCNVDNVYTNVDATETNIGDNNLPACFEGGIPDRDVWFTFTIPPGGITDLSILINGVGDNGIVNPQVALYRGVCGNLQELFCGSVGIDGVGETELRLDALGLFDNATYYLRINEFSGSATPNWGDFTVCVVENIPEFTMGDDAGSTSCYGTLYDSGGADGDYQNSENYAFTICPDEPHSCINISLDEFHTEANTDVISVHLGNSTSGPLIHSFSGNGTNSVALQVGSECVTVAFSSDGSVINAGFELAWHCSPDLCEIPEQQTCEDPEAIASLPFALDGLSTCYAGNNVSEGPCSGDNFLQNNEYIFAYNSPGDECIGVTVTGSNQGTGVAIYADCPDVADSCYAVSGGDFATSEPSVNGVYLEEPGIYYIVVGNSINCTPFDITVEKVECPIVMPSAADCSDALTLNSCGGQGSLPAIVSVAPGQGDPNFLRDGINDGCWGGFDPPNFTFFYFQSMADGNFAFTMEAANPNEASDVDFEVWGPIGSYEELCDYAFINQPVRSSYAAGADPTGLVDVHPSLGTPVTDVCEDAGGDDFVSTIPVQTGEFYIVLINDWGDQIVSGAISISFSGTTPGVLDPVPESFVITPGDTTICPGDSLQLGANGGEVYEWRDTTGTLSCVHCQNPVAVPFQPMTYTVDIYGVCINETREINVDVYTVDAGPDLTVCRGEDFEINAGKEYEDASYQWFGIDSTFSCMDCPHPIITAPYVPGDYTYIVTLVGVPCSISDTMVLHVADGVAPIFDVADDVNICIGESLNLGGAHNNDYTYTWSSVPAGLVSSAANPSVSPTETTEYFLEVSSTECAGLTSHDSVTVTVYNYPVLNVAQDTFICQRESYHLGSTIQQPDVAYSWSPAEGLDDADIPNPVASPEHLMNYVLTASNGVCTSQDSVYLNVVELTVTIENPDTLGACLDDSFDLSTTVFPASTEVTWTPDGTLSTGTGEEVVATPTESTLYIASIAIGYCTHADSVFIEVDSLPNLDILPQDTTICRGADVTLTVPTFDPAIYPEYSVQWFPTSGLLTEDTWHNAVVQPDTTTTYSRIYNGKYCTDTTYTTVNVITSELSGLMATADTPVCEGTPTTLIAWFDEEMEGDYEWQPGGMIGDTITVVPTETTTYTVVFNESGGCGGYAEASVPVTVIPEFTIDSLTFDPDPAIEGLDVVLTAHTTPDLTDANYIWQANGSEIGTTNVNTFTTQAPENVTSATYGVTIADSENVCEHSITADVVVEEPVAEFPNIFSPNNGDEKNNIFGAIVNDPDQLKYIQFKVYSRWGDLVYDNGNPRGWDGRYKGADAPVDTYVYDIIYEYKGVRKAKKGEITLVR